MHLDKIHQLNTIKMDCTQNDVAGGPLTVAGGLWGVCQMHGCEGEKMRKCMRFLRDIRG